GRRRGRVALPHRPGGDRPHRDGQRLAVRAVAPLASGVAAGPQGAERRGEGEDPLAQPRDATQALAMPTRYEYATVDVFTDRPFAGNPLGVVTDATGLDTKQMQAIAAEFNYSESTFVLPPEDAAHTALVRIFTRH